MEITLKQIKELRQRTGLGVMEAKGILREAKGDMKKALEAMKKQGQKVAAKKADREVSQGLVGHYLHDNGKIAALVEVLCETDFVARNEEFQELAKNIAMQIAAMDPVAVSVDELDKEAELDGRKPEEACLMTQKFFKEDDKTIEDLIKEKIAKLGENIKIGKFVRFSI